MSSGSIKYQDEDEDETDTIVENDCENDYSHLYDSVLYASVASASSAQYNNI
jgi:hypothetical protein